MPKRKAELHKRDKRRERAPQEPAEPDPALFIQAHEADIIRGPRGHAAALALEVRTVDGQLVQGEGLIQWKGTADAPYRELGEDEDVAEVKDDEDRKAVWVDRYDARLLLNALPESTRAHSPSSASPTGWSDLPSDTEDTFFLSPSEVEDHQRNKRRRAIEQGRESRLRALRESEGDSGHAPEDEWGGSDEDPEESQRELMRRTASHVLSSPNPAQLEMRILANHGADPRFAFLRGRWAQAWRLEKGRIRAQQEEEKRKKEEAEKDRAGLGGLTGYGDSDDNEDVDESAEALDGSAGAGRAQAESEGVSVQNANSAVMEARRARAREWAAQRRAAAARDIQQQNTAS
ncbi:uncharacterized protein PHACADRAFT_128787 [Phanerochaete carnosa HHB-10118-sp]|uniref:Uncharacterized protein n=1 Tax=Phanerochaete carnosa (strain HHB-10118-sp) TaxID=650164 RepID=K5VW59_PHACS|nr:uncharacterized protein PHACADRAFT_128787 [Phanerochaete carnosa HHB-10118-sp]EKM51065.1 hypothetical protein PHACADRAFT_128787 [Phanerochaete carnosa HHB-10118-sp]